MAYGATIKKTFDHLTAYGLTHHPMDHGAGPTFSTSNASLQEDRDILISYSPGLDLFNLRASYAYPKNYPTSPHIEKILAHARVTGQDNI